MASHGFVVQNKHSKVKYAVSTKNFDPRSETKIRDLKANETTWAFQPRKTITPPKEPSQPVEGPTTQKVQS